jgi:hypothetical protein
MTEWNHTLQRRLRESDDRIESLEEGFGRAKREIRRLKRKLAEGGLEMRIATVAIPGKGPAVSSRGDTEANTAIENDGQGEQAGAETQSNEGGESNATKAGCPEFAAVKEQPKLVIGQGWQSDAGNTAETEVGALEAQGREPTKERVTVAAEIVAVSTCTGDTGDTAVRRETNTTAQDEQKGRHETGTFTS